MSFVCGIDCGTQSTKVIVYDSDSRQIVSLCSSSHQLYSDSNGTMEQHPSWWITAIKNCFSQIDPSIKSKINAIGVSGQQHGLVALGQLDEVLCNAKLWCDTTTIHECEQIIFSYGGKENLIRELGNSIIPAFTLPKILWLKNNQPEIYKQLSTILLPHDYINFYFTGNKVMEFGDASGTGILDIRKKTWSKKILKMIDFEKDLYVCLPALMEAHKKSGNLLNSVAKELGLNANVIISSGGGDNMMGAIGTGAVNSGALTMSLGTSGTLYGYSDEPIIDPSGIASAFCSSTGGYLPLVCTQNCTVSTELFRDLFEIELNELEALVSHSKIGSNGVITMPFFTGERTPALPKGKGSIMGLTSQNMKKENMLRSAMEAAVFSLKIGLASFTSAGFKPKFISVIGGGAKSAIWRQMVADIFNLPVKVPLQTEAAAFGAALQALWSFKNASDEFESIDILVKEHLQYEDSKLSNPNPIAVKEYQEIYQTFLQYIKVLSPLYS